MHSAKRMAIFGFSEFVPTVGFSRMTALLLVAALAGDLIVFPALLLGPPGDHRWNLARAGTTVAPVKR